MFRPIPKPIPKWKIHFGQAEISAKTKILAKNRYRNCFGRTLGLLPINNIDKHLFRPETVDFDASGLYGAIIYKGQNPGYDRTIFGYWLQKNQPYQRTTIKLQSFSLYSALKTLGNPTVQCFRYLNKWMSIIINYNHFL